MSKKELQHPGREPEEGEGFPYSETPSAEAFYGVPESCFDLVNMYGTYEVQRTADTDNVFPAIAQGTPESEKDRRITKDDLNSVD